jgi:hypothetical protein
MTNALRAIVLSVIASALGACGEEQGAPSGTMPIADDLIISGVTIVNTHDGTLAPNMSIQMSRGKIVSVVADGTATSSGSVTTIDAHGKFVVPGFNDMHAHVLGPPNPTNMLTLMLVNGITGWRQMAGTSELLRQRRDGTLPLSGIQPELLGMPGMILTVLNAGTPERGVAVVREQKTQGADFIKMILVNSPTFFAVQAESKRLGLPMVGHLPTGIDVVAASKGGMKSIEHLGAGSDLEIPCSSDQEALRAAIDKAPPLEGFPFTALHLVPFKDALLAKIAPKIIVNTSVLINPKQLGAMQHLLDTYSEDKCRQLAADFVADGTWQVPTLIRIKTSELADSPEFLDDPNLRYVPADQLKFWRESEQRYVKKFSAIDRHVLRDFYALRVKLVKLFDTSGVKLMTGDDVGGSSWVVPGFGLHREFDEFESAGVSPLHVLQDATLNSAEYLGRTSTMGSVEVGKGADLVLLDANPIDSVQNLHKIDAVVRAGHYLSRKDLDAMLDRIQAEQAILHWSETPLGLDRAFIR